ncbi:aspartyl/asparaginyl beta-hydroxylase domain-containing protein [Aureibacter tunicatorum]|uniref:Aspartyl/asparaginy/proline hydroxylase domain-containing protein n=1 Tax=Aureibacter tunicatorum TaxID=866807 RepID=A0AAE4BRR5_9BACT|nr:aspartyl/asparaginyl beta-hydroxylase domain-containing protein [Aureibacter tunicatorum]MDR6238946.1 hypothetical protein [Aureibacter tunicatorum]
METEEIVFDDRIRLPFTFDYRRMMEEVDSLATKDFTYYNVLPLRAPAHVVDNSLPFPPPSDNYADGSWTDWMNTEDLETSPYLKEVVDFFAEHTKVTLVRLLRLAPNCTVEEHVDPTLGLEVKESVIRLTVPITVQSDVKFYLNSQEVLMEAGECWYLRLTDPHKVVNSGSKERINLTIDMQPNDWIRAAIEQSMVKQEIR